MDGGDFMGDVILFLLAIITATFILYCMAKVIKESIKNKKNGGVKKIKPKDVIKIVEPIKKVYSKMMPDGSLIESAKVVGEKTTYLFKRSKKEIKNMNKGVLDRDFVKYQDGVKASREAFIKEDSKKGGKR